MIEYPDIEERRQMLERLVGIEDKVWVKVEGYPRVYAIADEDLERDTDAKTSAVHFLRFELDPATAQAVKRGAQLSAGIDHPQYNVTLEEIGAPIREALAADLA
jgi:hypothetical protein